MKATLVLEYKCSDAGVVLRYERAIMDKSKVDAEYMHEAVIDDDISEKMGVGGTLQETAPKQKKSKGHMLVYMICSIIIAVAVLLLILYIILERHGKKEIGDVTDGFISSLNGESKIELYGLLSTEHIDYMSTEYGYSKLDVIKEMENSLDFFKGEIEDEAWYDLGAFKEITVYENNILAAEPDELSAMKDYFSEELSIEIDDYAEVHLKCHVIGEKRSMEMMVELYLYKIDEKWYFLDWYWDDFE